MTAAREGSPGRRATRLDSHPDLERGLTETAVARACRAPLAQGASPPAGARRAAGTPAGGGAAHLGAAAAAFTVKPLE